MGDSIRSFVPIVLLVVLIGAGFSAIKKYATIVVIDSDDQSMDSYEYPPRRYSCDTTLLKANDLRANDVVAYWLPNDPEKYRVARVVAVEGQSVEADGKNLIVDGVSRALRDDRHNLRQAQIRIPRGCVFLMTDKNSTVADSLQLGPLPFYQVIGKLRN